MKRYLLIIFILAVTVICFWLAFFINPQHQNVISLGINIISGISTLITLVIALILFNKFGIEKSILDKNTETVFDLLQTISKTRIILEGKESWHQIYLSDLQLSEQTKEYIKNTGNKKLIFSSEYFDEIPRIIDLVKNVFTPKEIAKKAMELNIEILQYVPQEEYQNYFKVSFTGNKRNSGKTTFGLANQKQITFDEYVNMWQSVIDGITKWLSENSSIVPNLNIYTKTKN